MSAAILKELAAHYRAAATHAEHEGAAEEAKAHRLDAGLAESFAAALERGSEEEALETSRRFFADNPHVALGRLGN